MADSKEGGAVRGRRKITDEEIMDPDSVTIDVESKDGADGADGADGESIIINSVGDESGIKINVPVNLSRMLIEYST